MKDLFNWNVDIPKYTNINMDQLIIFGIVGSHMYGTSTPDSDKDYLGVYLPTEEQLLLNDYPKSAKFPKATGVDLQLWSIHHFMKLAMQGETMAIDLLHMPEDCIIVKDHAIWGFLKKNRTKFYTKNMNAFVSYARKQAAKYGIKGERIQDIENAVNFLSKCNPDCKLRDYWDRLPEGKHIHFLDHHPFDTNKFRMYQVAGKKMQETVKVSYALGQFRNILTEYGNRAMLAKENQGIDWKAISHAIRSADQVYDILKFGDYDYPLRTGAFIRNVKLGRVDFISVAQVVLEDSIADVEKLIQESDLPDEVDKKFWNEWIIFVMKENVL